MDVTNLNDSGAGSLRAALESGCAPNLLVKRTIYIKSTLIVPIGVSLPDMSGLRFDGSFMDGGSSFMLDGVTKKCETFGCPNPAVQMHQIAPGTNVWLCEKCLGEIEADRE